MQIKKASHIRARRAGAKRSEALKALHDDVTSGDYPAKEHLLSMEDAEFKNFIDQRWIKHIP